MSIAIVYASKHGTTQKVVERIKKHIGENATLFDIKSSKQIDIMPYETVVIGASIHAGSVQKKIARFCKNNLDELLNKKLVLFLSCMETEEKAQEQFNNAYPEQLRNHSVCNQLVGGEFLMEKMNFVERKIIEKISGHKESVSRIDEEKVNELINSIK